VSLPNTGRSAFVALHNGFCCGAQYRATWVFTKRRSRESSLSVKEER